MLQPSRRVQGKKKQNGIHSVTRKKIIWLTAVTLIVLVCGIIFFLSQRASEQNPTTDFPQPVKEQPAAEQPAATDSTATPTSEIDSTANEIDQLHIDETDTELSTELDF